MTMVRLNAEIRRTITETLLKRKYVKDDLAVDEATAKEAEALRTMNDLCYEAAFTKEQRKVLASAASGMFPEADVVNLRIERSPGNYYDGRFNFNGNKPVPFRNSFYGGMSFAAVLDSAHPFVVAYDAYQVIITETTNLRTALREKRFADMRKLSTILDSVTTVKRLTEVWPEVIEFLPEMVSGLDGGVPAQMIADINKEFGL